MHWADKKGEPRTIQPGGIIPHYSQIIQVYNEEKWVIFNASPDLKRRQDSCNCAVHAVSQIFHCRLDASVLYRCF